MATRTKFLFSLVALYVLLGSIVALPSMIIWSDLGNEEKRIILHVITQRPALIIILLLLVTVAVSMTFAHFYRRNIIAPLKLQENLQVMLDVNRHVRLEAAGSSEFQTLTTLINHLADQRYDLQHVAEEKTREANASAENEKDRLTTLISELEQSVVGCNVDGRILLYNKRARRTFCTDGEHSLIGLGRSIFSVIDPNLFIQGARKIQRRANRREPYPQINFVTLSRTEQLVRVKMAPLWSIQKRRESTAESQTFCGYILIFEDITCRFDSENRREHLLRSLMESCHASLATARAATENLLEHPSMAPEQRIQLLRIVNDETNATSERLDRVIAEFVAALTERRPLEGVLGADLIRAARQDIEQQLELQTQTEDLVSDIWLKADSFLLLRGVRHLAKLLVEDYKVREIRFRLTQQDRWACLDLICSGVSIDAEKLLSSELETLERNDQGNVSTLQQLVERQGGTIVVERDESSHCTFFRILIPAISAPDDSAEATLFNEEEREYYDFELLQWADENVPLEDRPLNHLTYTAFDTETTGLRPSDGDEIIQIGAVRILNKRILKGEVFDRLIDPRHPVSKESLKIHAINTEMLIGQPTIEEVLPHFHAFCEDTVLLAHNAAFDMRFLKMKEDKTGITFNQPVLDTMLLSKVIHPHQSSHNLEAIAQRFGIEVMGRHTALGDATIAAKIFLHMIPLLNQRGIHTVRQANQITARMPSAQMKY